MLAPVLLGVVAIGLGASGWLVAASLRVRPAAPFLLAVYVIAWTELVLGAFLLSALGRPGVVLMAGAWALAAWIAWSVLGRPPGPDVSAALRTAATALRDPRRQR